jgi:hypothetical protein
MPGKTMMGSTVLRPFGDGEGGAEVPESFEVTVYAGEGLFSARIQK